MVAGLLGSVTDSVRWLWKLLECVATRVARGCKTATRSLRCFPSKVPMPRAVISPSSPLSPSWTHRMGDARKKASAPFVGSMLRCCLIFGSRFGNFPNSKSSFPPYFFGMSSMSMKVERVGTTSCWARINILEVVIGSNHFLIHPQTTGKNDGAPMTFEEPRQHVCRTEKAFENSRILYREFRDSER